MSLVGVDKEDKRVTNFRTYLQIPTVHPNVDYSKCVEFIQTQAKSMGLPSIVHYMDIIETENKKPLVIITLKGRKPELSSILLTSHMDVVPVYIENWTNDPFSAYKDEKGNIYARGAQDMKSVGIQYLEAIRRYIDENLTFDRTIHISFTPDEETGGIEDEGLASEDDVIPLFYGERAVWQFYIRSRGTPGHGSMLFDDTAAEKLMYVVNKILDWRTAEKMKLSQGVELGKITSVNMTILKGGNHLNVVPQELFAGFDVRLAPDADHQVLEDTIVRWCHEAGNGIKLEEVKKNKQTTPTKLDDTNPWWLKFKSECDKMGLKLKPCICPGAGDSRYIRLIGISALGFSPMMYTPILLHDHNEYLNENTFLKGIDIYYNIIKSLATE